MLLEFFEVWEIDLYGCLFLILDGDFYIFIVVDLFLKYLFVILIRNKDVLMVFNVLFKLFIYFGVCNIFISD